MRRYFSRFTCTNQPKKGSKTIFLSTQNNKTIRENISCVFGSKQVGIFVAYQIVRVLEMTKNDILQLTNLLEMVHCAPEVEILEEFGVKDEHTSMFKVHGYISSCEHGCGRSATDRQFYFINSRPCDVKKVSNSLR